MTVPDFTPYAGLLPSQGDPATFSARAQSLFTWFTQIGAPQLAEMAAYLSETVEDGASILDAVHGMQTKIGGALVPVGAVLPFTARSLPEGWLPMDGRAVTDETPDLRQMLIDDGAVWGVDENGDPRLADLRGEFLRGWDNGRGVDSGRAFGSAQGEAFKAHGHRVLGGNGGGTTDAPSGVNNLAGMDYQEGYLTGDPALIEETGGAETRPRNVALIYAIKAFHSYADMSGKIVDLGTAAGLDASDFATAEQGVKADSAVQPAALANLAPLTSRMHHRSIAESANTGGGVYQGSAAAAPSQAASPELQALGVTGVRPFVIGSATLFKRDILPMGSEGAQAAGYAYVYSDDGENWPSGSLRAFPYSEEVGGASVTGTTVRDSGYDQISPNLRRYWALWTFPDETIRSVAYGFDTTITDGAAELGGFGLFVAHSDVDLDNITYDDWSGFSASETWRAGIDGAILDKIVSGVAKRGSWNILSNPTLDPNVGPVSTASGALSLAAPTSSYLASLGIVQVGNAGTGGGAGYVEETCLDASMAGQNFLFSAFVYSETGADWATPAIYWYAGDTLLTGSNMTLTRSIQITEQVRLYHGTGTVPNSTEITHVRVGSFTAVSGFVAEVGGFSLVISEDALTIESAAPTNWLGRKESLDRIVALGEKALYKGVGKEKYYSIAVNGDLKVSAGPPPMAGAGISVASDPGAPFLRDLGIEQGLNLGASGGAGYWLNTCLSGANAGQEVLVSLYVWSETGRNWPALTAYWYGTSGNLGGAISLDDFELVAPHVRLYHGTTTLPVSPELATVRLGCGSGDEVTGSEAVMSGLQIFVSDDAIAFAETPRNNWRGADVSPDGIAAAVANAAPMRGLNIVAMGDSITQSYTIPEQIAALTGANVTNCGHNGTRMAFEDGTSGALQYKKHFSAVRLAQAINTGDWSAQVTAAADYVSEGGATGDEDWTAKVAIYQELDWSAQEIIYLAYGTNDFNAEVPLGAEDSTDETTFHGAMNEAARLIIEAYPNVKVCFVTPMWRGPASTHGDSNTTPHPSSGLYLYEYQNAIKNRCAYYQLPCFPLDELVGINLFNESVMLGADDLHPQEAGATRWAETFAAWARARF